MRAFSIFPSHNFINSSVEFSHESKPQFCALLKTALLNRQDVRILGWDLERSKNGKVIFHGTFRDVVQVTPLVVSSYLCSLDKETVVLGADAYDTLFSSLSKQHSILTHLISSNLISFGLQKRICGLAHLVCQVMLEGSIVLGNILRHTVF